MLDKRYEELEGINTGELLEFERAYLNGEHALQPESGYPRPFHPGEFGLAASLWGFGIEGGDAGGRCGDDPLIEQGRAVTLDMRLHRFEPQR